MKRVNDKKISKETICFVICLILLSAFYIFIVSQWKESLSFDELFSYGSSNHKEGCYPIILDGSWHDESLFTDYLSASQEHRFDYNIVWKNQANDVHPPIYYAIMHTICSFVPRVFTKWVGIGVNIVSLLIAVSIFYIIAKKVFKTNSKLAIIASFVYGTAAGTISMVLFLRMYVMVQIACLLLVYIHLKYLYKKPKYQFFFYLYLITCFGTLVHYYYLIFAFFSALIFCLYLLFRKQWKDIGIYCLTMGLAAATVIQIFPAIIVHIFYGYRGTEAFENLSLSTTNNFIVFSKWYFPTIFGKVGIIFIIITVLYIIVSRIIKYITSNEKAISKKFSLVFSLDWVYIVGIIFLYIALVYKIIPYQTSRYFALLFPLLILVVVYSLYQIIYTVVRKQHLSLALTIILLIIPVMQNVKSQTLYANAKSQREINLEMVSAYQDTLCVVMMQSEGWTAGYYALNNYQELMQFKNVYYLYSDWYDGGADPQMFEANEIILCIYKLNDIDDILFRVCDATGLKVGDKLFDGDGTEYYYLYK